MSWEKMKKEREQSDRGSLFIKLKDGESIEGVFKGEPHFFYQKFKDRNEYSEWAEGRSFKFRINFLVKENGTFNPKIFQGGSKVRDMLLDARDEYGTDCIYKIKRTGSSKEDTRYSILFKLNLTPDLAAAINLLELHDLVGKQKEEPPVADDDGPPWD